MTLALAALLALHLVPLDVSSYRSVIKAQRGRVVLVDFWATWCEPCRAELPGLAAMARKLHSRGLVLVTVSADEPEQEHDARELLEKIGVPPPVYIKRAASDENFINAIDRQWSGALPAIFLYDRRGKLQRSFIGESPAAAIEAAAERLLR
jgi:cytochrome c biogenesis protein CcmG, thiol:disulfide interchange protein DsbE